MKNVQDSERFQVSWGRKDGKICAFFIHHKNISLKAIHCNPENLLEKMTEFADKIDKKRGKII